MVEAAGGNGVGRSDQCRARTSQHANGSARQRGATSPALERWQGQAFRGKPVRKVEIRRCVQVGGVRVRLPPGRVDCPTPARAQRAVQDGRGVRCRSICEGGRELGARRFGRGRKAGGLPRGRVRAGGGGLDRRKITRGDCLKPLDQSPRWPPICCPLQRVDNLQTANTPADARYDRRQTGRTGETDL